MKQTVIDVQNVTKTFKLQSERRMTIKDRFLRRPGTSSVYTALEDVSFSVARGESIALIGRNGAGKSTMLKLLSRIIYPTSGTIKISGRIAGLLELGAGFHPDFTGRENIFVNASILGFSEKETQERVDEIIEFAEIGQFIDSPVRNYSSGMYMRLAFSVAIMIEPDIFLIDEVLSVGDIRFQEKCLQRLRSLQERDVTIVMVSHSESQVRDVCGRAIWIDEHHVRMDGEVDEIFAAYNSCMKGVS